MKGNKGAEGGHKARVAASESRQRKLDKIAQPSAPLRQRDERGQITFTDFTRGRWTRPDKYDTRFRTRLELGNESALGYQTVGQEDLDYLERKKAQGTFIDLTNLASYLIDPNEPMTQERAYGIFPELETYPDELFQEELSIQMVLRELLKTGMLKGKQDHELIFRIIQPDYKLPIFPLWDPTGEISKQLALSADWRMLYGEMSEGVFAGIFNPRKWQSIENAYDGREAADQRIQFVIKTMILCRLYPGIRKIVLPLMKQNKIAVKDTEGWMSGLRANGASNIADMLVMGSQHSAKHIANTGGRVNSVFTDVPKRYVGRSYTGGVESSNVPALVPAPPEPDYVARGAFDGIFGGTGNST